MKMTFIINLTNCYAMKGKQKNGRNTRKHIENTYASF